MPLTRDEFKAYHDNYRDHGAISRPSLNWYDSVIARGEFVYLTSKTCGSLPRGVCYVTPKESGLFVTELHVNPIGNYTDVKAFKNWSDLQRTPPGEYKLKGTFTDSLTTTHIFSINEVYNSTGPTDFVRLVPTVYGGGHEWSQFIAARPHCPSTTITNITFPTSVPAIEDLKGTLNIKNADSVKGVGRVRVINRDTGETMATTGGVELSAGQEAPIEFSMKMLYNILRLRLAVASFCMNEWKEEFIKDLNISPLFAEATIGNLNFPVGQMHGEKFSISFDLTNVGAHGLARLRILDMDTNKEVFSTGPTELSSSKAFTYSGTMPTTPLNLRLVVESVKTDNKWYEDAHTDISLKSLCREGAVKVIDFPQGRVITEICKAGEWVENPPPMLKIIDISTPSFSKLEELFKVEVKCRNEGGMGASMVADQQFDILGGETKTVAYTLKMPAVDEHLFKIDARSLHSDGKWHTDDTKERGVRAMDSLISEIGTGKLTMATGSKSVSFNVAVRGREVEILGKKIPFGVTEIVVGKIAPYSSFDIEGKGIHYIRTRTSLPLVLAEDRKIIGEGRDYVFSSFKRPFTYIASKTKAVLHG